VNNKLDKKRGITLFDTVAALLLAAVSGGALASQLQVFPFPEAVRYSHHNDDYTVRVRTPGGVWQDLYEYKVKVDMDTRSEASMVYFNFDGPVEVAVQKNNGRFSEVKIRPAGKGVKPLVKGHTAYFTLERPENLSIEFDDDRLHNLHLFSHAIRKDMPVPPKRGPNELIGAGKAPDFSLPVVYFGPGVHDGEFNLRSNSTVYIDGSALLKKPLILNGVENVKVISDGLFDSVEMMTIKNSRHVLIDGPIFFNQPHGTMRCITSQDIEERSIRSIGAGQWSDGLGHFSCERVTVADSFIRTSDDSITLYNHRWDIWGSTRDIVVKDSTLWADIAHAVMIGIHGNTPTPAHPEPEVLERIRFSNIDILDHDEDDPEYEGAIGIMAGDDNLVRDVTFEDIRVDRIEEGKLFNLHIAYTPKYNTSPGRGIENVVLRTISFTGEGAPSASVIYGYDAQHKIKNIVIDNVTVAGRKLKGAEPNVLDIGPFVEGVSFK
jgi:hypothetical protein